MASTLYFVAAATVAYLLVSRAHGLRTGIAKARESGLPYIVVPWSPFNLLWQLSSGVIVPLVKFLPSWLLQDWFFILESDWAYKMGQGPFERLGDSFLTVFPGGMFLTTQDPVAIQQITARREQFPKPTRSYRILAMFGRNVLTTEGAVWRLHRKATSSAFNERNTAHTFAEAVHQTQGLLAKWMAQPTATITTVEHDTMTLALNIIGYVGFGLRLAWPDQPPRDTADAEDPRMQHYISLTPPPGHSLTFAASIELVLSRLLYLTVLPHGLLRVLSACLGGPFREAYQATTNFRQYMRELMDDKTAALRAGSMDDAERRGMDLMGQLVRSRHREGASGASASSSSGAAHTLTDDEIIGNAFIMLAAGHETTANTLHFTLIQLATNPASQRAVQADVDRLLGRDSDPTCWDYDANINGLMASMVNAALNETLRTMPPVVMVPKGVTPLGDQLLTLGVSSSTTTASGKAQGYAAEGPATTATTHVLPAGMGILVSVVSAHRHPGFWPTQPSRVTPGQPTDLDDYVPERWFRKAIDCGSGDSGASVNKKSDNVEDIEDDDYDGNFRGPDSPDGPDDDDDDDDNNTSAQLFHPVRGSFLPFSDGARSCVGRRIAQVEILAALAVLFQRYSLELAVDGLGHDGDSVSVDDMSVAARVVLYARAQARARATLRAASSLLTLRLHGKAAVPLRLVPRGQERFIHIVDA